MTIKIQQPREPTKLIFCLSGAATISVKLLKNETVNVIDRYSGVYFWVQKAELGGGGGLKNKIYPLRFCSFCLQPFHSSQFLPKHTFLVHCFRLFNLPRSLRIYLYNFITIHVHIEKYALFEERVKKTGQSHLGENMKEEASGGENVLKREDQGRSMRNGR